MIIREYKMKTHEWYKQKQITTVCKLVHHLEKGEKRAII